MARGLFPHMLLFVFACVLILPLVLGRSLYWGDIGLYFAPMAQFQKESLQKGILPLWNPYVLGGQPFVGNPQMGWLYPTVWLLPFVSVGRYLTVVSLLHLFLAGEFTWLFLRNRRLSAAASLVGALAFMGCDAVVSRLQFPPMIVAAAYLPLILLLIDRIVAFSEARSYLLLAAAIALCLLTAHAQVTYLILVTVSLYALLRVLSKPRPDHIPLASRLLLSGLLGMMLCLPYLLPVVELLRYSHRTELTAAGADRFVVEPHHLLNFVVPHFTGHPASGDFWGGGNAWEPSCFLGWLPLVFAVYAVWARRRVRSVRFWGVFGLLCLWMSFGTNGGLFWVCFNVMPGMSLFHDPARFLILTSFALAILGAFGVDHWLKSSRRKLAHSVAVVVGTALPLAVFGWQWNPAVSEREIAVSLPVRAQTDALKTQYFPLYDAVWDTLITEGYRDYATDDRFFLRTQFGSFLPNATMLSRVLTPAGYEPIGIDTAVTMQTLMRKAVELDAPNLFPLLEARGVGELRKAPLAVLYAPLGGIGNSSSNGWHIVYRVRRVDGLLRLSAALNDPTFDPNAEAIVSGGFLRERGTGDRGQNNSQRDKGGERQDSAAEIAPFLDSANRWRATVRGNGHAGLLVTPLTDYPGWNCFVDGKSVPIFRVNMASMGVEIPAGDHRLVFVYRPASLRVGLYLGGVAWCGFVAWAVSLWTNRSSRRNLSVLA